VASGLLGGQPDHLEKLALMALGMQSAVGSLGTIQLRIGIDVGPVVAGVIGRNKFIYDLWGDTGNTASRMESHGIPGTIHVTERARERLASGYEFEDRGMVEIEGKGPMRTYILLGPLASSYAPSARPRLTGSPSGSRVSLPATTAPASGTASSSSLRAQRLFRTL